MTAQWWRRACPQPQPSWTEQGDTIGLVGTMTKAPCRVRVLGGRDWVMVEVTMFATLLASQHLW